MRVRTSVSLVALLWSGLVAAQAPKGGAPSSVVTTVMTEALPDYPGKEALVLTVSYPPGGATPLHHHDAHVFVYVVEGSVVMAVKGGKEVTLTKGQSWSEKPGEVHTISRNASQTKPARLVVFMLKDIGKPVLTPGP